MAVELSHPQVCIRRLLILGHLMTLIFFLPSQVFSNDDVESLLSKDQIALLGRAHNGGFVVALMSGMVEEQPRTVVLLGESHFKNENASDIGRDLLDHFDFYGIEGAGVVMESTIAWTLMQLAVLPNRIIKQLYRLWLGLNRDSTIHDVLEYAERYLSSTPDLDCEEFQVVPLELGANELLMVSSKLISLAGWITFSYGFIKGDIPSQPFGLPLFVEGYLLLQPFYTLFNFIMVYKIPEIYAVIQAQLCSSSSPRINSTLISEAIPKYCYPLSS